MLLFHLRLKFRLLRNPNPHRLLLRLEHRPERDRIAFRSVFGASSGNGRVFKLLELCADGGELRFEGFAGSEELLRRLGLEDFEFELVSLMEADEVFVFAREVGEGGGLGGDLTFEVAFLRADVGGFLLRCIEFRLEALKLSARLALSESELRRRLRDLKLEVFNLALPDLRQFSGALLVGGLLVDELLEDEKIGGGLGLGGTGGLDEFEGRGEVGFEGSGRWQRRELESQRRSL
jgi:hypothetical protein